MDSHNVTTATTFPGKALRLIKHIQTDPKESCTAALNDLIRQGNDLGADCIVGYILQTDDVLTRAERRWSAKGDAMEEKS